MDGLILYEDTGQKIGKHDNIKSFCQANGIEIIRIKLKVGDYTLPTDQSICIDTKAGCEELYMDLVSDTERFRREYHLADKLGIRLIILVEDLFVRSLDDFESNWTNPLWKMYDRGRISTPPRPNAVVRKQIETIQSRHSTQFLFCHPADTGQRIVDILTGHEET